jgi:hypothetical protein
MIRIVHRDEVEEPFTDWLREAYEYSGAGAAKPGPARVKKPTPKRPTPKRSTPKNKAKAKAKRRT